MHYINRSAAVISARQKFVHWLNDVSETEDFSLVRCNANKTAILLPDFDDETQAQQFIRQNWQDILRHEVVMQLGDQSKVPADCHYERFREWFTIEISGDVYDMAEDELEKEFI